MRRARTLVTAALLAASTAIGAQETPPAATAGPERAFESPVGLLFTTVRPERVEDFETVLAHVQAALARSTDPTIRAQAEGWRVYRAAERGPNDTVLYVFVIDPAVPGADYALGRILADAYPEAATLKEVWDLYAGAVTSGGSLLNLTPVEPPVDLLVPAPNMLPPGRQESDPPATSN